LYWSYFPSPVSDALSFKGRGKKQLACFRVRALESVMNDGLSDIHLAIAFMQRFL
jgi:hypothetical protein